MNDRLLIVQSFGHLIKKSKNSVTYAYTAAGIDIPSLRSSTECRWRTTLTNFNNPSTASEIDGGCSDLLKTVGVRQPNELIFPQDVDRYAPLQMDNCTFEMETDDHQLALFSCSKGHVTWFDTEIITSRAIKEIGRAHV